VYGRRSRTSELDSPQTQRVDQSEHRCIAAIRDCCVPATKVSLNKFRKPALMGITGKPIVLLLLGSQECVQTRCTGVDALGAERIANATK
jgi:hypothetical protein